MPCASAAHAWAWLAHTLHYHAAANKALVFGHSMPGVRAGGDGLISALRGGGLEPERGGQAAELAHAVAKHDIKARIRLQHAA